VLRCCGWPHFDAQVSIFSPRARQFLLHYDDETMERMKWVYDYSSARGLEEAHSEAILIVYDVS